MNSIIFWKCINEIFQICRFRFLPDVTTKWQLKCTFFDNLRTITKEVSMEIRQMTLFVSSIFSAPTVCNIHFWNWKYSKFIFMWSILVCKMPQFLAKSYRFVYTFLESRHSEVTENLHYVLSIRQSQISIFLSSSSWTISLYWPSDL